MLTCNKMSRNGLCLASGAGFRVGQFQHTRGGVAEALRAPWWPSRCRAPPSGSRRGDRASGGVGPGSSASSSTTAGPRSLASPVPWPRAGAHFPPHPAIPLRTIGRWPKLVSGQSERGGGVESKPGHSGPSQSPSRASGEPETYQGVTRQADRGGGKVPSVLRPGVHGQPSVASGTGGAGEG